jgi:hypothetical protein
VRFYMLYSGGPPTATNLTGYAADVGTAWLTAFGARLSHVFSLNEVIINDLTSDTSAEGTAAIGTAGSNAGEPVDVETCVLQNFTIGRKYRGGRPRMYWPLGVDSDLNADFVTWSSVLLGQLETAWVDFIAAIIALTGFGMLIVEHVSVSFYDGFTPVLNPVTGRTRDVPKYRTGNAVIDLVTSSVFRPEISQQRRRRTSTSP